MKKIIQIILFGWLVLGGALYGQGVKVPSTFMYCGIQLEVTPGAQAILAGHISSIYESPRYFNAMVEMCDTYMPFIDEAFGDLGIPKDLKYIVIQESSLKPDAVSSSNAVGFWQFKLDPGLEYGLRIDEKIDERKHIYRSSFAAASYFKKANYDFDNWVYAVISYYEGLTGAVKYTKPEFYGRDTMVVDEQLHWYAMKAIAHYLAYHEAVDMNRAPKLWLEPFSTRGEHKLNKLCASHGIETELFRSYNRWIKEDNLPKDSNFTYYIPRLNEFYPGHKLDPQKPGVEIVVANPVHNNREEPVIPIDPTLNQPPVEISSDPQGNNNLTAPRAIPVEADPSVNFVEFNLKDDLQYGNEYVLYDGSMMLSEIANRYKVRLSKLLTWNNFAPGTVPETGTLIYLKKAKKVAFHIVEKNENLYQVSLVRSKSVNKILKKNRFAKDDRVIYIGQKLYLKKKKPKGEQLIILRNDYQPEYNAPEVVGESEPTPSAFDIPEGYKPPVTKPDQGVGGSTPATSSNTTPTDNGPQTKWIVHVVEPGDTLWNISTRYGTKVEIIKLTNKLTTDALSTGMELRILARVSMLQGGQ
ncbi:MAG: LysM peptidoglycan-binding domain-containing protein [Bacteroidota bacterium]